MREAKEQYKIETFSVCDTDVCERMYACINVCMNVYAYIYIEAGQWSWGFHATKLNR